MIIFGTRGVTYSGGSGSFFCPSCDGQQPYAHKRVRRFFSLYFIPVIPLDLVGEYIECASCRGTFQTGVLDFDPAAAQKRFEAEFERGIKRVMVQMALADGVIEDEEVETIRKIYGDLTRVDITEADVRAEIEQALADGRRIEEFLGAMAGNLNDSGKELVVKAAFFVAAADGVFQEEEKALLGSIGNALKMSPAHFNGVIASLTGDS
ncbi:MAG: tellurite resistance TerB family protein [Planctomycetota bacterium]|jgi:tellurite resistance protein